MKDKKIAIIHDFLTQQGGAERVLKVLSEMYPQAPIYTLLHDPEKMGEVFAGKEIKTSYLQKFPKFLRRNYRWLIPFFPVVPETFDLREFELVISSSGAWSKGIVTKLDTLHVAYIHSPMRFAWDRSDKYVQEIGQKRLSFLARFGLNYLRIWDKLAADRPDFLVANSRYTQKRIEKYYRRQAKVIYPPVEVLPQAVTGENQKADYFLVVSRLSPYKKVDVVVEAFNKLGLPLIIIGTGEQEAYLRKIAQENVQILGWQSDEVVAAYLQKAKAFVFPCEDDFGIAPVEAMAAGVPVLAYNQGGVLETVQEGVTGEFFAAQTAEVLADGVRRLMLNEQQYDKELIKKRAAEFSKEKFMKEFEEYVNELEAKK